MAVKSKAKKDARPKTKEEIEAKRKEVISQPGVRVYMEVFANSKYKGQLSGKYQNSKLFHASRRKTYA